jgi:hypothetical protein
MQRLQGSGAVAHMASVAKPLKYNIYDAEKEKLKEQGKTLGSIFTAMARVQPELK